MQSDEMHVFLVSCECPAENEKSLSCSFAFCDVSSLNCTFCLWMHRCQYQFYFWSLTCNILNNVMFDAEYQETDI